MALPAAVYPAAIVSAPGELLTTYDNGKAYNFAPAQLPVPGALLNQFHVETRQIELTLGINPQGTKADVVTRLNVSLNADGTLNLAGFGNQSANIVFAGPSSGGAATPLFRALVTADISANMITAPKIGSGAATSTQALFADGAGNSAFRVIAVSDIPTSSNFTWTGIQNFSGQMVEAITYPAQITADQNNYNPANLATSTTLYIDLSNSWHMTGITAQPAGTLLTIVNTNAAFNLTLQNQNSGSTAANRFLFDGDIVLTPNFSVTIQYDGTASRWRYISRCFALLSANNGGTGTGVLPASGQIPVGNAGNTAYAPQTMGGDGTISNTGSLTIANLAITNAKIANTTIDLTTKVTGVLPIANGGTNASGALTNNQLMYSTGGTIVELGAMTNGQLVVGKAASAPQIVTMGGDGTISNTGSLTITKINGTSFALPVTVANGGTGTTTGSITGATNSNLTFTAGTPAAAASTAQGNSSVLTASPATAGTSNAGAAAGGDIQLNTGAAARLTSGNANGGNILVTFGAGIGTGNSGQIRINSAPTGDVLAQMMLATGVDTNKGLVVIANSATQSANLTEWQNNSGVVQSSVTPQGWHQHTKSRGRWTADTSSTSTALTHTNVPVITLATRTYSFLMKLYVTMAAASGFQFDFGGGGCSASAFMCAGTVCGSSNNIFPVQSTNATLSTNITSFVNANYTNPVIIDIFGTITVSVAGTFIPEFALNTGTTQALVKTGSWIWFEDVP